MANMRNSRKYCITDGEKKVWDFFDKYLSKEFWIWTNVKLMIQNRGALESNEIDAIIYNKDFGLEVFSIKDWRVEQIKNITNNRFVLNNGDIKANPFLNAEQHRFALQSKLKKNEFLDESGRPQVCVNAGVIFPYIKKKDFENKLVHFHIMDALDFNIPINTFLFLEEFEAGSVLTNDHQAIMRFRNVRDRRYSWVHPFSQQQLDFLDSILSSPEDEEPFVQRITADPALTRYDNSVILKLDEKQKDIANKYLEKIFKKSGPLHRLIKGIAGSGKTILLQYLFVKIAEAPHFKILFVVFNNALMRGIKENLVAMGIPVNHPNYEIATFFGYCETVFGKKEMDNFKTEKKGLHDEIKISEYIKLNLSNVIGEYDFVLIDEGQDLRDEWVSLLVKSAKEGGSVVYTEDFEQNLYGIKRVYSNAGLDVKGQGQDRDSLLINYRNTKQINEFALKFSEKYSVDNLDRLSNLREGPIPEVIMGKNATEGAKKILDKIVAWEQMAYSSGSIAILYPIFYEGGITYALFKLFEARKRKFNCIMRLMPYKLYKENLFSSVWKHEKRVAVNNDSFVKMSTLQTSKGLDFDCVILICENLAKYWTEEKIKNALYVGATRARYELALSFTGEDVYSQMAQRVVDGMKNN